MALRSPSHAAAFRPSPAPPRTPPPARRPDALPATTPPRPAARRPDAPRTAAQGKGGAICVDGSISGNVTHCQGKRDHTQNKVHHAKAISSAKGMLRPDSSDKHRIPRSSGGTYLKPDPRVRTIPPEEIMYIQHRKPYGYGRTVRPHGLQKRHSRRSVTPPPSSRKVSIVESTPSIQNSMPSCNTCLSPKRLDKAKCGHSSVGEHLAGSVSHQIGSLQNPAPPSCKSSQPSSTLSTDAFARNRGTVDISEACSRSYGSRIMHPQSQSKEKGTTCAFGERSTIVYPERLKAASPVMQKLFAKHKLPTPVSKPKEAALDSVSPSPKQVLAPCSSEHNLGTKSGPYSKRVCTPENEKMCSGSCNLATSNAAAILQAPTLESALLSPRSVLGERSTKVYPDRIRTEDSILQKAIVKREPSPSPVSLLSEKPTEVDPNSKSGVCTSTDLSNGEYRVASLQHKIIPQTHRPHSLASSNAAPVLQSPVVESALLSPASVLGERYTEVCPDRRVEGSIMQRPIVKHTLPSSSPVSLLSGRSIEVSPHSKSGLYTSTDVPRGTSLQNKSIPQTHRSQSPAPAQCYASSKVMTPVTSINCDTPSESHHKGVQETGTPVILHTKLHKKHYQPETRWKGNFHVTGELRHTCDGLQAHFPCEIFVRVYEASKKMPETLELEAVPLPQLWPKKFKMKPPDAEDIGLCFISSRQRPHRTFDHLLEKLSSHMGLWTNVGDTELSIFSSKLLAPDYQRKDGKLYCWGVFGKRLRKKQRPHNNHVKNMKASNISQSNSVSCDKSEEIGMKFVVTEGKEKASAKSGNDTTLDARGGEERDMGKSKGLDVTGNMSSDRMLDTAPGFSLDVPPGFTETHCHPPIGATSVDKFPSPGLNALPGFPTDIPPGFTEADRMLPTDIPPGFTEADRMLPTAASAGPETGVCTVVAEEKPLIRLPNVPPGFTEAHRMLPTVASAGSGTGVSNLVTGDKPHIRFSLNVPKHVKTENIPGFSTLLPVKKEPGSHAIDKATEKLTPSSIRKAGEADEMRTIHDKARAERDENSEERETPKLRRLSDLYRAPASRGEACRSVSSNLSDKFRAMEPPEKQRHPGKRGLQEPPEPSPADDATKRLRVNGRIALNNSACQSARAVDANILGRPAP